MKYQKLLYFLQNFGKDPSGLMFEDYLTGLNNRRFLLHYLKHNIDWGALDDKPVSLVMIDIDFFKRINASYGSTVGDQVLAHVAGLLKDICQEKGIPILYAGDEFMVLLPGRSKQGAVSLVAEIFYQIKNQPLFSSDAGREISFTLSMGIATAPDDASDGEALVHQVKNALYHAKQLGRNRYADAGMVSRQAVHYLQTAGVVGRKSQFDQIGMALKKFGEGIGQVVIIDGGPGMGKTSFIDTVHRNLEKTKYNIVRVAGVAHESYRPYYLIAYVVMALMNQREDHGVEIVEAMTEKEIDALGQIIPQMVSGPSPLSDIEKHQREEIFRTFARFFSVLAGKLPLVILIDDLHYADPASLHLIRVIIRTNLLRLFICGTAGEENQTRPEAVPLALFRTAYGMELALQTITLSPLTVEHVEKFINMTFHGLSMPHRLIQELTGMTQGNPLFMVEVLRKMIVDQKILLKGRVWHMARLEKRYFPRTLEEIIQQKMNSLDEESKRFLECASAFGESISLSMLTGSYSEKSSRIHDFLNQGMAHGLVMSQFRENDENIRFSSHSVREIIYEGISADQKRHFHEEIGAYHEKLYKEDLLPSAAPLAFHFKRSGNSKKEGIYGQHQNQRDQQVFAPEEIPETIEEKLSETGDAETPGVEDLGNTPLSEAGLALLPKLLRSMLIAVRNIRLYPADSKSVISAMEHLGAITAGILAGVDRFSVSIEKQTIVVNGRRLETQAFPAVTAQVIDLWDQIQLKSLTFKRGLDAAELYRVLAAMSQTDQKIITPRFWKKFFEENRLTHVLPRQVTYTKVEAGGAGGTTPSPAPMAETDDSAAKAPGGFEDGINPNPEILHIIQKVFSAILGAYSKVKLYPGNNPVATDAVRQLQGRLQSYFSLQSMLNIARVQNTLLVNGVKVDTTGFETMARSFLKFLAVVRLNSITFLATVTFAELMAFIAASVQSVASGKEGAGPHFWPDTGEKNRITGILFDQRLYGVLEEEAGEEALAAGRATDISDSHAPLEDDEIEQLPERIRQRYLTGDMTGAEALLKCFCDAYSMAADDDRKTLMDVMENILSPEDWRPTAVYLRFALKPILPLLQKEKYDECIQRGVALLNQCGVALILFGEYDLATWVFAGVGQIYQRQNGSGSVTEKAAHPLADFLSPPVVYVLSEDLKSGEDARRQQAYQLVSSMGTAVLPLLADLIKREEHMRPRILAAELIRNSGKPGVDFLKAALAGENSPVERARIMDVIDSVTTELSGELAEALSDRSDVVQKAAIRLAERLNTPESVALLMQCAQGREEPMVIRAVNALGKLGAAPAAGILNRLAFRSDSTEVLTAVCRAMGRIGDPAFVPPLARLLTSRRLFLTKKKYPPSIRAAAAMALSQIAGSASLELMRSLANDPEAPVREAARALMAKPN
jgi:diguanylate cyclase (GGDEF)-like protein